MPQRYQNTYAAEDETHYVGGTATGLHILATGVACLVVWGWTYAEPWETSFTMVRLVTFPVDGAPQEYPRSDGTRMIDVSEPGRFADPLASCSTASGDVAVLVREGPPRGKPGNWAYSVCRISAVAQMLGVTRAPVNAGLLYDTLGLPQPGTVRMATDGAELGLASSRGTNVRIAKLTTGAVPRDVNLTGTPSLPGLVRLEVASVRFTAGAASIGLTAYLNHPGVGPTSVGAVLRLRADGSRDASFADNGLWVSPLMLGYRDFVCAGELNGLVAGSIDRRAVVFAADPFDLGGGGLDGSFANGGIAESDLGGLLATPVTAADANGLYVFGQRVPVPGAGAADLRSAGCRFRLAPGTANHGTVDPTWAKAGTLTVRCDGAPVTPTALAIAGSQLFIAGTRQIRGADLDRIPVVVAVTASTGDPIADFGNGGFALHGSIAQPALVDADGSAVFVERSTGATGLALRFTSAAGEVGRLVELTSLPAGSAIGTLTRLPNGSLLIAGGGAQTWVAKIDATGAPDMTFGTGGIATPKPSQGMARALGVRASGDISLRIGVAGSDQLALMHPDGSLDTTYGTGGFVDVRTFTHPGAGSSDAACFLDADGSVIVVVSSEHAPASYVSPYVTVALRRVTMGGAYDPQFGLGALSVNPPAAGRYQRLVTPDGGSSGDAEYSSVAPAGICWLGGRLYVVATGWTGGRYIWSPGINVRLPRYPLLLILGWNADGSVDATLDGTGRQEAGWYPDRLYWSAAGILPNSPTTLYAYGLAGEAELVTSSLPDGKTWTSTIVRQPQPALYRIEHPTGLDRLFGGDGAATVRLQEVLLSPVAGALVNGRVRVACVDALDQPTSHRPRTNLGGLVQWAVRKRRPPRPPIGPAPRPLPGPVPLPDPGVVPLPAPRPRRPTRPGPP